MHAHFPKLFSSIVLSTQRANSLVLVRRPFIMWPHIFDMALQLCGLWVPRRSWLLSDCTLPSSHKIYQAVVHPVASVCDTSQCAVYSVVCTVWMLWVQSRPQRLHFDKGILTSYCMMSVHVRKERQMFKIFGALHYGVRHNYIIVLARKTLECCAVIQ